MKIIDIGMCIDNIDPLGIGRIRCSRYNDYTGQKEKAIDYDPWSDRDLFTASPFLPSNINYIPEINQSVKIISYNTDKETVNVEYIAGPFTTMYDYNGQTFSQQITNTTYGTATKHKPNIRNTNGKYVNDKSENTFAKERDYAIYGKYGSDIIFTENGLQLRGGKLLSKEAASQTNRETLIDYPLMAKKSSRFYLKKFPKKMILEKKLVKNTLINNKDLKYIIEYSISCAEQNCGTNSTGLSPTEEYPTTVKFYVKKVTNSFGDIFKTNYFTEHSTYSDSLVKLINTTESSSEPTFTSKVTSVPDIYREIRDKIFLIHDKGLSELNSLYPSDDVHPFFFKPRYDFKNLTPANDTEKDNKQTILNSINITRVGPASGMIWSLTKAKASTEEVETIEDELIIDPNSPEQTFGSIMADKFYILSTDLGSNESSSPVPFYDLNKYDLTQEDYIRRIEENTFSTVRGENLLELLNTLIEVMFTHVHNPAMPIVNQYDYDAGNKLKELFKTLENDILNKSIRIN